MSKKGLAVFVYLVAGILMIIRIDFWWWGTKIQPIIWGWLTIPMVYQFLIWLAGYVLVLILCLGVWDVKADEAAGKNK